MVSVVKRQSATTSVWKMMCRERSRATIPMRNALSCRQMQANGGDDDECGDQVGFGGFVRATEGI